jgi:hypothetical protein
VSASVGSLLLEMWPLGVASRGYGNNGVQVQEPDMVLNIVLGLQCLTSLRTVSASDTEACMCPPLFCGENERRGTKMLAYLTVTCLPFCRIVLGVFVSVGWAWAPRFYIY